CGRPRRHRGHAARDAARHLPERNPDRPRYERRPERRRHLQADPGRAVCGLLVARVGRHSRSQGPQVIALDALKAAVLLFVVAVLILHFLIGDPVSGRRILLESLVPTIVFNLVLTAPVYWIVTKLLPPLDWRGRAGEVRLLG